MEQMIKNDLSTVRRFYTRTLENITHFLKIILDRKKISSQVTIDKTRQISEYKKKPSWFLTDEIKLHVKAYYDTDNSDSTYSITLLTKFFSGNSSCRYVFLRDLFSYELKMQEDVLPKIETLLQSKIGLQLYYHSEEFQIFFLQDLLKQGYLVKPFYTGLSDSECIDTIQLMAKLHAASVALNEKDPALVAGCNITTFITAEYSEHLMQVFRMTMKNAIALMKKTFPLIADKMQCINDSFETIGEIIELFAYESNEFCVINNGEFSTDNLIFPEDSTLLPSLKHFQMAHYSSPAIDLHYFLNTSPKTDVIYDQDEQILEIYLKTLTDTLENLNCITKPPTMRELKAAMQKRELYAVFAGMTFKLCSMKDRINELERLYQGEGNTKNIYHAKKSYEELAKKMCVVMFHRGYFDCTNGFYTPSQSPALSDTDV